MRHHAREEPGPPARPIPHLDGLRPSRRAHPQDALRPRSARRRTPNAKRRALSSGVVRRPMSLASVGSASPSTPRLIAASMPSTPAARPAASSAATCGTVDWHAIRLARRPGAYVIATADQCDHARPGRRFTDADPDARGAARGTRYRPTPQPPRCRPGDKAYPSRAIPLAPAKPRDQGRDTRAPRPAKTPQTARITWRPARRTRRRRLPEPQRDRKPVLPSNCEGSRPATTSTPSFTAPPPSSTPPSTGRSNCRTRPRSTPARARGSSPAADSRGRACRAPTRRGCARSPPTGAGMPRSRRPSHLELPRAARRAPGQ